MRRILGAAVVLLVALSAFAQIHGTPPSVTYLRPGFPTTTLPPPSVTSMGPYGYSGCVGCIPNYAAQLARRTGNGGYRSGYRNGFNHRHFYGNGLTGAYVVPYYEPYPVYLTPYPYVEVDPGNAGIYDPLASAAEPPGSGANLAPANGPGTYYAAPSSDSASAPAAAPAAAVSAPAPAPSKDNIGSQQPTTLVFRDGHQLEIQNYAISGGQVYNYSGKGPRRIPLFDLDLDATRRVNDEHGVQFQLP